MILGSCRKARRRCVSSSVLDAVALSTRTAVLLILQAAVDRDMVAHMKTTIEIADPLLEQAKRVAAREGTTVRALVEQGLRAVLAERRAPDEFRLRKATFKGKGFQPDARGLSSERIRELAYEGRGG
jgi:Bacterial antitoxin of type II TA system, VapB